jgi:hypothetical protein
VEAETEVEASGVEGVEREAEEREEGEKEPRMPARRGLAA